MEDLFGLLVWIVIFAASISSKKKKKKQQAAKEEAKTVTRSAWAEAFDQLPGETAEMIRTITQMAPAKAVTTVPAQPSMPLPVATPDAPAGTFAPLAPVAPTVHTHLEPDCAVHDAPGSLAFASTEGKDPCHEEQFAPVAATLPQTEEQPGLALDFTGDNLVRAFVMQEVLTRPCDRRPRGYAR